MLEEVDKAGGAHVVSWLPSGKAFKVHQADEFVKKIIPLYFKQKQYKSFQRQLHLYGFLRYSKGPEKGAYYHKYFVKEDRHLSHRMTRKLNGEKTSLQQAKEKKRANIGAASKKFGGSSPIPQSETQPTQFQPDLFAELFASSRPKPAMAPIAVEEPIQQPVSRSESFERFESLLKGLQSNDDSSSSGSSSTSFAAHHVGSSSAIEPPSAPPLSDFASDLISLFRPNETMSMPTEVNTVIPSASAVSLSPRTSPIQQQRQVIHHQHEDPLFGLYDFHPFDVLDPDTLQDFMPSTVTEV